MKLNNRVQRYIYNRKHIASQKHALLKQGTYPYSITHMYFFEGSFRSTGCYCSNKYKNNYNQVNPYRKTTLNLLFPYIKQEIHFPSICNTQNTFDNTDYSLIKEQTN
jgi:hypothetical protein